MARAAHLSGRAINISKTTAPHALSYYLTMQHGVPHGHAAALTLGAFFVANQPGPHTTFKCEEGARRAAESMADIHRLLGIKPATAASAKSAFYDLVERVGLAPRLRDVGVALDELPKMAGEVNVERLANNPAMLTQNQLQKILESRF